MTVQYSVKNQALAPGDAGPSLSRLFLSLNQTAVSEVKDLGLGAVPAIKAASTVSVTRLVTLPADLVPGRYYFGTEANPTGVVLENDDGNNVGFSQTRILVGPDIVPTAATTSAGVATGMNASVSYTLRNQGGQVASNFNVAFALVPVSAAGVPTGADIRDRRQPHGRHARAGRHAVARQCARHSGCHDLGALSHQDHRGSRRPCPGGRRDEQHSADGRDAERGPAGSRRAIGGRHTRRGHPRDEPQRDPRAEESRTGAGDGETDHHPAVPLDDAQPAGGAPLGTPLPPAALTFVDVPVPSISGGGTATVKTLLPVPSLAPGKYWVVAQANALGSIVEADSPTQANDVGATLAPILVGPDLVVTAATVSPLALAPGFNVSVTSTVKNQGGAAAGPFDVGIYLSTDALSTDAVLDAGDTLLATRRVTGGLAPGAVSSATTPVVDPRGPARGDYVLIVRADAAVTDGEIAEADETNNNLPTAMLKVVRPDLVMQSVTATPAVLAPGANVSVTQVIKNIAPASGTASATTSRLYLSDVPSPIEAVTKPVIGDVPVPPIAGAAMASITRSVQIPPGTAPGKYWIYARANTVDPIAGSRCPGADQQPPADGQPDRRRAGPDSHGADGTGAGFAQSHHPDHDDREESGRPGDERLGRQVLPVALRRARRQPDRRGCDQYRGPRSRRTFTTTSRITLPANTSAGPRFLLAQADNGAPEADLTNNTLLKSFTIDRPDLQILSITPPAAVIRGRVTGAPTASVVVKNTGASPSAPFEGAGLRQPRRRHGERVGRR